MGQRIHTVTLDKPAFGNPCNGCGTCCIEQVCEFGLELGDSEHCKALVSHGDGSYSCGLIIDPYRHISAARRDYWQRIDTEAGYPAGREALRTFYIESLGAGRGCDSSDP